MLTATRDLTSTGGLRGKELVATVINNNHPDKNYHIQCRIPELHKGIKDEDLPWFRPDTGSSSQANTGSAGQSPPIPPVGSKVKVMFDDDSQYYGRYLGSALTEAPKLTDVKDKNSEEYKDYPNAPSSIDPSGTKTIINYKRDTREVQHVSGTTIKTDGTGSTKVIINNKEPTNKEADKSLPKGFSQVVIGNLQIAVSGDITIACKGKLTIISQGDAIIASKGKLTLAAGGELHLSGSTIHENTTSITVPDVPDIGEQPSRTRPETPNVANMDQA